MDEDPPNPTFIALVGEVSAFSTNGFAALDNQPKSQDGDNKSDRADSLFGGRDDSPVDDGSGSHMPVKQEDVKQVILGDVDRAPYFKTSASPAQPAHGEASGDNSKYFPNTPNQASAQHPRDSTADNPIIIYDDDDGCMIVDQAQVPAHAWAKFAESPWRPKTPDIAITAVKVKQEPGQPAVAAAPQNVPDIRQHLPEPMVNSESVVDPEPMVDPEHYFKEESLFGDGDMSHMAEINPSPGVEIPQAETNQTKTPNAELLDDEAMFVDEELEQPAADNVQMEIENVVGNIFPNDNDEAQPAPINSGGAGAQVVYGNDRATAIGGADVSHGRDSNNNPDAVPAPVLDPSTGSAGPNASSGFAPGTVANEPHAGDAGAVHDGADGFDFGDGVNGDDGGDGNDGFDAGDEADGIIGNEEDDNPHKADDVEFILGDDEELSDGERPRARRRKPNQKKKTTDTTRSLNGDNAVGEDEDMQEPVELDREDLEDELKLLEAELDLYTRRKAKGKHGLNDERLDKVTRKIVELKAMIDRAQPTPEERAAEGLRRMLEEADSGDENGQGGRSRQRRPASRIPAIARNRDNLPPSSSAQKRKSNPGPASAASRAKKQKTGSGRGRGSRVNISKTTQALLEMARSNDPIAARAQMDDLQVFTDFKATTVKEQIQKLKEQIRADPDGDQRRINADLTQLTVARKAFGRKFCKPKDGQWQITGMTKLLHHYQLVGAGWMLRREVRREGPFGGVLADSVGLGKTIEAIACIVGNPPSDEEKAEGKFGTLVVVPSNLLAQWQDEINACCPDITVVHYHSAKSNRVRMSNIRKADIVVTTYHEIAKGFPHKDKLKLLEGLEESEVTEKFNESLGELFTVEWHRIILDEAHAIKNGSTHTSKACINLKGKYRWCLTATPLHNGLYEILPYMQFTRAVEADPIANPNDKKSRRPRVTGEQINDFIANAMMSRKIDNLFLGKALFQIPMAHPLPNVWISLSEEEFIIYKRIEEIIRRRINRAQAMPGIMKKRATASFFSLAIRLRQAVSHPFTLFYLMRDIYDLSDIKEIRKQMRVIKRANPNRRFVEQVGSWCEKQLANGRIEGEVIKPARLPDQFGKGDHGYEFNMDPQLAKMEKLKSGQGGICSICEEPYTAPRKTKCNHVFCRDCIESVIETEKSEGSENISCPVCNKEFGLNELMGSQRKKRAVNPQMPGSDWNGLQPLGDEESAEFLEEADKDPKLAMAPSAKTVMVKDIILKWQTEASGDKIIVFTQWVVVGRVLGRMLQQENIGFVYFFGEMTREEKEDNIKAFHAVDEIKVMIASLKCGGQGLNLTCANRVILVDPWWNSAVEHQGYGRVFRMGQEKETWFVRLLTRKTIDGRMAKLQAKKLKEINGAIKDFDSTRASLNFEEVAELFGRVTRDENGKMIGVESDYDTDDDDEAEDGAANDIQALGAGDDFPGADPDGYLGNQYQAGNVEHGMGAFQDGGYGPQEWVSSGVGEGSSGGNVGGSSGGIDFGDSRVGNFGINDL